MTRKKKMDWDKVHVEERRDRSGAHIRAVEAEEVWAKGVRAAAPSEPAKRAAAFMRWVDSHPTPVKRGKR